MPASKQKNTSRSKTASKPAAAAKKSTKSAAKKNPAKSASRRKTQPSRTPREEAPAQQTLPIDSVPPSPARELMLQVLPFVLGLCAILLLISLLTPEHMGLLGGATKTALSGLVGGACYLVPILLAILAILFRGDAKRRMAGLKFVYAPLICLLVAALLQLWANPNNSHSFAPAEMWKKGVDLVGGGVLGGLFGEGIFVILGEWGTPILLIAALLILTLLLLNLTPATIYLALSGRFRAQHEELARREEEARLAAMRSEPKRYTVTRSAPRQQIETRHLRAVRQPSAPERGRHAIRLPLYMPEIEPDPTENTPPTPAPASPRPKRKPSPPPPEPQAPEGVLTEGIPISIYGRPQEGASESEQMTVDPQTGEVTEASARDAAPASLASADKADSDLPPWEESGDDSSEEKLSPVRIRKKAENAVFLTGSVGKTAEEIDPIAQLESVISDDVMEAFRAGRQNRPEGGEVDQNGQIVSGEEGDVFSASQLHAEDKEFALAIQRLSAMEGILPAEKRIGSLPEEEEEILPPYELPPITLLHPGEDNRDGDVSEELNTNATRLVDTLRSFRVRTRLVAISRGPAITRYELAPEEGVKVRSIANLVDDIALNLATTGVRIEAPIPGKSAVGVEVPNQKVELVALRDLIDTPKFADASSLIMVALGMDVAGTPIFLDIAKMPHLLIAGTTGSGKSVSINCMLVSLLYHAAPDQVKLILIDPKKVELNIYNGLPHLLVPVVSDPKKAAGALHWAVTEMERRFEMIEAAGVRDLKHYNAAIEGNPDAEFLPQIVIVIDELADLMMTSRDEVETSICRIAQKARAAGMHLIIGTQRPSVDVVTGVIKANIPSRIAFKVAGQMDSRVILDMTGAEKLIGNGDMLYAPVGCTKPIRVQGAFVSSEEVDEIVSFIKNQSRASYDASVMNSIDEAAERCGSKKGAGGGDDFAVSGGDDGGENDPMLKKAIELAVESGKISTSLIQRRLSLGYGRAAKLIDRMETLGIVGPPDGQRPRQVLITSEQYVEMVAGGFGEGFR